MANLLDGKVYAPAEMDDLNNSQIARRVLKGVYRYFKKNLSDNDVRREQISKFGSQLNTMEAYQTAFELLNEFKSCVKIIPNNKGKLVGEENVLLRVENEKIPSKVVKGRIKSQSLSYGILFSRLEISKGALESFLKCTQEQLLAEEAASLPAGESKIEHEAEKIVHSEKKEFVDASLIPCIESYLLRCNIF